MMKCYEYGLFICSYKKEIMNIHTTPTNDLESTIQAHRSERMKSLLSWDIKLVWNFEKVREYQPRIIANTKQDIISWIHRWRWDIAVAWGKSAMSLSFMKHIVDRWWKVLFLTPGNTEINNIINSHEEYGLWENNYLLFSQWSDITSISNPKYKKFYDNIGYYYSTAQMLTHDNRHTTIPQDFFDLIVFEESHSLLWDVLSWPQRYFWGSQIHMSATPFNMQKHVASYIPHQYGEVTTEELIEKYGFPSWIVRNYYVEEGITDGKFSSDSPFDFENEKQHRQLNISQRFTIMESICEEIVLSWDRKWLWFMPSVRDAEIFTKYIVPNNPILRWKVDFVAWERSKSENEAVEKKLRKWELKVVLSKDLWNQAIDIPDLTDIILNDPTRSLQRLIQRIWRWARPSPGKHWLYIHDIVSSFFHSEQVWVPAVKAEDFATKNKPWEKRNWYRNWGARKIDDMSPEFLTALQNRRVWKIMWVTSSEVELREVVKKAWFFADIDFAIEIFAAFATQVFHVSYNELFHNFDSYLASSEVLSIDFNWKKIELTLSEARDAAIFYCSFDECEKYDYFNTIANSLIDSDISDLDKKILRQRNDSLSKIEDILEANEALAWEKELRWLPRTFLWEIETDYISELQHYVNLLWWKIWWADDEYTLKWNERKSLWLRTKYNNLYTYIVWVEIDGEVYEYWWETYCHSKMRAKKYAAMQFLNKYKGMFNAMSPQKSDTIFPSSKPRETNLGAIESISLQMNNFITSHQGSFDISYTEERNKDWRSTFKAIFLVKLGSKTIHVTSDIPFFSKKKAKENISGFFLNNIKEFWEKNVGAQEFSMHQKFEWDEHDVVTPSVWNTVKIKNPTWAPNSNENISQQMNNFITGYQWSCDVSYKKKWVGRDWGALFTCSLLVKIRSKTITVTSDVNCLGRKKAKENISRFFLENIQEYWEKNIDNQEFAMHQELNNLDVIEDIKPLDKDLLSVTDIIENTKMLDARAIIASMTAKSIVSRMKYDMWDDSLRGSIKFLRNPSRTFETETYPFDPIEGKSNKKASTKAREQAAVDILTQLLQIPYVQKYWSNKIK